MHTDPTDQDLERFDINTLTQQGRQALRERRYGLAVKLLRAAARRAPFRQDLREGLTLAMQGAVEHEGHLPAPGAGRPARHEPAHAQPAPAPPPRRAVAEHVVYPEQLYAEMPAATPLRPPVRPPVPPERAHPHPQAHAAPVCEEPSPEPPPRFWTPSPAMAPEPAEPEIEFHAETQAADWPEVAAPRVAPPLRRPAQDFERPPTQPAPAISSHAPLAAAPPRGFAGLGQGRGARTTPPARRGLGAGQGRSESRPTGQRRPIGALVFGLLAGFLLLGAAGAGGWYVFVHHSEVQARNAQAQRLAEALERANAYKARGDYTLALEQLNTLPPSPQRDAELGRLYLDKGMSNLNQTPPDYPAAIQDYTQALKFQPDNAQLGSLLGKAYYQLALMQRDDNREAADTNLQLARTTFDAVLDREPNSLDALDYLAKIATLQRDPVLQRECYLNIIKINPQSREAEMARRNLQSLGMRM